MKIWLLALVATATAGVIPRPVEVKEGEGQLKIEAGGFVALRDYDKRAWVEALSEAAGVELRMAPADVGSVVQFLGTDFVPDGLPKPTGEGYVLRIQPQTAIVHADTEAGHFYGLQTLVQLLEEAERDDGATLLPCATVIDSPRFGWRGFMLDESRHFSGKEAVLRLLDQMARYKLNRFHWHLTDSPGWRIEIKRYPKLTEIGSRGSETDRREDAPRQFYTQDEVREIVAYARERGITVVPEIDMPGHADAAVRAYPEHDGGGFKNGKPFKWSRFTFNPAKPETLAFLDGILEEVADLFPDAGVIHFGGDEVHFGWGKWKELPEVKALMEKEGFSELAEVETWFNRRMAGKINELGFATGGWDEIAGRDLPRDGTLVFWWRHDKPQVLRRALDDGYPVVLCPRRPLYFDFVQHDSHKVGRRWGGFNPLDQVYAFPDSLNVLEPGDADQVRGIQANLWTETTVTQARRDFMTFPRLLALAEAAWTPADRKDFADFEERLKDQLPRLDRAAVGYYDPYRSSPEVKR